MRKRGFLNGIRAIWKSLTGNLDASESSYFNECLNKITQNEHELDNWMRNEISVTSSVNKCFNATIQKHLTKTSKEIHDLSELLIC